MISNVSYDESGLIVTIATACPENLHENLMRGLSTALASGVIKNHSEISAVLVLLQSIIPTEEQLSKLSAHG